MARLTNKDRAALRAVLAHLERAHAYIQDDRIAVAQRGTPATTTLHYTRADGSTLYELNKQIGSPLTGLESGISALSNYLVMH